MADGRQNNKGTKGNKGGRPPKADEQKLIEKLSPLEDVAFHALEQNVMKGQSWAVKLFFEYRFGKPRETVDMNHNVPLPPKKVFVDFGKQKGS